MNRWDVINKFIQERNYTSYLEIGYYKGWSFDNVKCKNKTAIDPNPSKIPEQENIQLGKTILNIKKSGVEKLVKLTSDEFFERNNDKYDIIFIDGLHEAKQVEKDIINSLSYLNDNGVILLHDCNPPTEEHTLDGVDGCWNGDVYKAIMAFKVINPNIYVIDTDWGIGVIEKFELEENIEIINELEWEDFNSNRQESIGLVSLEDFKQPLFRIGDMLKNLDFTTIVKDSEKLKFEWEVDNIDKYPIIIGKRDLVFMSAQPDDLRFSFQIEVQLENFIKMGYTNNIHILLYIPQDRVGTKNERFKMLEERYRISNPNIKFFWYEDINNEVMPLVRMIDYIPLIRPWTLKQHFTKYPELSEDVIFYHDNDIIFNKYLDFKQFMNDDICYLSNTDHYMNSNYFDEQQERKLISKPDKLAEYKQIDVLDTLAKMNGISRKICEINNNRTGGAQQILKNIDANYWEDVFNSVVTIRQYLRYNNNGINAKIFGGEDAGIQSWCADMWALIWNLWKRGIKTETPAILDFAWATDNYDKLQLVSIYHDAGATTANQDILFNKNRPEYITNGGLILPYREDMSYVDKNFASYKYVQEIQEVKTKYNY